MENTENIITYTISSHAMQRYAERIMGKDNILDVSRFVTLNEDKIKTDINKLIQYGELIYTGKQATKDGKGGIVDVYLKDCWIILADNRTKNVITLYKVDLGLEDDFNKSYVLKMVEKLNQYKATLEDTKTQVQKETDMYKEMIECTEAQIKEYKGMIKNLEELCVGYKTVVDNNAVKISQANRDVAEIVNTLVSKREF